MATRSSEITTFIVRRHGSIWNESGHHGTVPHPAGNTERRRWDAGTPAAHLLTSRWTGDNSFDPWPAPRPDWERPRSASSFSFLERPVVERERLRRSEVASVAMSSVAIDDFLWPQKCQRQRHFKPLETIERKVRCWCCTRRPPRPVADLRCFASSIVESSPEA